MSFNATKYLGLNFFLEKRPKSTLFNVYHDTILYRNKLLKKKDNTILSSIKTQTNGHQTFLI